MKLLPCLTTVILATCTALSTVAQDRSLEEFVDSIAEEHVGNTLAGLSIGVTRGSEVLLKKSYGLANIEYQVPMAMDAVHEVGSVTKQFTTVAMMQLVGQERIDLEADVTEYLPEFDTQGYRIPVKRLLDHTSGMKGFTEMEEFRDLSMVTAPRENILRLIEQYPFDFEPGDALIYNNSAYFVMGLMIEAVSGQSYEDYLEEHVFPLAGMDDSSYCSNSTIIPGKATGYSRRDDEFILARYHDHTWPYSAGSVCSTVSDLLAWNAALHHGEVLSDSLYQRLVTPQTLNDGTQLRYAAGLVNYDHPTGHVIEHGGAIDGFLTHSRYYPEHDVAVVVLQNTGAGPGPSTTANRIGEHLFGTPNQPEPQHYTGDLTRFEGTYRGAARGAEMSIEVSSEGNELSITLSVNDQARPPQALNFLEGSTFFLGPNYFIFDSPDDGNVSELRFDAELNHYVLKAVN